jgi:hypothetical protein
MNGARVHIRSNNVLVINLADNAIDCFVRRLVVRIEQAIRVAVEAFRCHLLLVSSRNQLRTRIQCLSKNSGGIKRVTCELEACVGSKVVKEDVEDPFCESVPGASPIAASFCLL